MGERAETKRPLSVPGDRKAGVTRTPVFEDLLALVQDRSAALRSSAAGAPGLAVRVPSCPDWSLCDLVEHLTQVQRFWAAAVVAGPRRETTRGDPGR
jgi:mycothiol maleylpyruvate isomerase-like protein